MKTLHTQFISDCEEACSYSTFCRYVPANVIKPKATDWGTCLCQTCLNPELKLEALAIIAKDDTLKLKENQDENQVDTIIQKASKVKISANTSVTFTVWRKV